jgi:M6 family metalloprotease-like protein
VIGATALVTSAFGGDKLLTGIRVTSDDPKPAQVSRRCLASSPGDLARRLKGVSRAHPWSLPTTTLGAPGDTLRCLVLRFNFQYESVDDPNTTGRGIMDLSNPLTNPTDSAAYYNAVGHWVDPPPHNSDYFNAHMRALNYYWSWVSEGKINLTWDMYPPGEDSIYQLAHPMAYYGACAFDRDSIVIGLEKYFIDCIHRADSASIVDPGHPVIDFSQYDAIFLFHAGSDRQNDIGFPTTCSDLFTGFIRFNTDSVAVNGGSYFVKEGLMMPEAVSQDNRPVALNAVMAHEFGHQLGLPDIYATNSFLSQVGDFSLMDDNGFGTGLDFGFEAGKVFGAMPIYPDAWCRAYLGISPVVDFRQGADVRVVAAEAVSNGIKIARVPISETEYYLIENRVDQVDKKDTVLRVDSLTNVFLYPSNSQKEQSGEYDYLIPGSGVLIYHVDEAVAALDYDGNGRDNYQDNHIQIWDPFLERRFLKLIEADGIIDFGGYYQAGYGRAQDMFRDDRNDHFTPNSNPQTIDNSGNATHIFVTDIRRDTVTIPGSTAPTVLDTAVRFSVTTEWLVDSFPVRCGRPTLGLSPVAADLNKDGTTEIIAASEGRLLAFEPDGRDFLRTIDDCGCPLVYDTIGSDIYGWTDNNQGRLKSVPIYSIRPNFISAGPVVGGFATDKSQVLVAVGYPINNDSGQVITLTATDLDDDGMADSAGIAVTTEGWPVALTFGDSLFALTVKNNSDTTATKDTSYVYFIDRPGSVFHRSLPIVHDEVYGICRVGNRLVAVFGDNSTTTWYHFRANQFVPDTLVVAGTYNYGPIAVDLNRDSKTEIVGFSKDGDAILVSCDTSAGSSATLTVLNSKSMGYPVTTNPIAGDLDRDGYPEIIIGGVNALYAHDERLVSKTDFPVTIDDRFPQMSVIASPICGNVEGIAGNAGTRPNLIFPTEVGNVYALGSGNAFGFPLNSGEQVGGVSGSPSVLFDHSGEGRLGYLGGDGWFYLWRTGFVPNSMDWPMGGSDPSGSFSLSPAKLDPVAAFSEKLPKEKFYNYPNPVTTGLTTIRYFLGSQASSVKLEIYDFSGTRVSTLDGGTVGGTDNEVSWSCGAVTPGVYRCVITADFGDDTQTAFTDIAVIR